MFHSSLLAQISKKIKVINMKQAYALGIVVILSLSCLLASSIKTAHSYADWTVGGTQRLWTTNSTGQEEIDEFEIGDPVYFKTSGINYPIAQGNYTIYLFAGNLEVADGMKIPSDFGTPLVTMNVSTDNMGRFGQTTPILLWSSATTGNFTIILDQIYYRIGSVYYLSTDYGIWHDNTDYRDDLCTAIPTPPSFHVVPQVPFGTVTAMLGFFCGLGLFLKRKKNKHSP
jgi:hypothetical protein